MFAPKREKDDVAGKAQEAYECARLRRRSSIRSTRIDARRCLISGAWGASPGKIFAMFRYGLAAFGIAAAVLGAPAVAIAQVQAYPPPPPAAGAGNPVCQRLEAQLVALDRGASEIGRAPCWERV